MNTLKQQLSELQRLKIATYGKDFLLTWEKTDDELRAFTLVAEFHYAMHKAHRPFRVFNTGLCRGSTTFGIRTWWQPLMTRIA